MDHELNFEAESFQGYQGELEGYEGAELEGYEAEFEFEDSKQNALDLNDPSVAKVLRGALSLATGVKLPSTKALGPQAGGLLRTIQKQHRIKPNGVVGSKTLRALGRHIISNLPQRGTEVEGEGPIINSTPCLQRCKDNFTKCNSSDPSRFGECFTAFVNCMSACSSSPPTQQRPTLRRGSYGPSVVELQTRLNRWLARRPRAGLSPLVTDGKFGPKTDAMVRAFQRDQGLQADGVVGSFTWGRLLNF